MSKMHWFTAPNLPNKKHAAWRRTFGISDVGQVFVPAAMSGEESELAVMFCAADDGQPTVDHLDHYFVPSLWLVEQFPKFSELVQLIEERALAEMPDLVSRAACSQVK